MPNNIGNSMIKSNWYFQALLVLIPDAMRVGKEE